MKVLLNHEANHSEIQISFSPPFAAMTTNLTHYPLRAAIALTLLLLLAAVAGAQVVTAAVDEPVPGNEAGLVITNRAEVTYLDSTGAAFTTISPVINITILSVSSLVVTPDETEPSASVAPYERVQRFFRICNAGNTPDLYTIIRAEVSAPATIHALYFDTDASGSLTDADRPTIVNTGMSARVARGTCIGLIAVVETNASEPNSRLQLSITARSNVSSSINGMAQDDGTVLNSIGTGARFSAPGDQRLPPVKLIEDRERITVTHGQALNYIITFRNSGDINASGVVLRDELPAGLEYIAGTLRLNGRNLSDADDADEGHVSGQRLEIRLANVAVNEIPHVAFQARVRSDVAHGRGIVNQAVISADNAAAVATSSAVAVVDPFGLVYEGRSGGTAIISGARVALLRDTTEGIAVQLTRDAGTIPNERNENPMLTDAQGRWSFSLAPDQLGSPTAPAHYFLNVTAQGFRPRMLEMTITPQAVASVNEVPLFALTVKALDGQPIARSGSFELTEENVTIEGLAAFALNVPMFENSTMEITKSVDRSSAEIGDVVSYRLEVRNATDATINDTIINDILPPSFHYATGTARLEQEPAAPRAIEPQDSGAELIFRLGELRAGARAIVTYRVRIGVNAREGEQQNTAAASGLFLSGERATTNQVHAAVRVRRGVFSTQQIILGRVYEDANSNGQFDKGERPVTGARLYLNNGQSVVTDSAGQYNFPSVSDGSLVISLDPLTLPTGYMLSTTGTRDSQSWTRLLRTPLGGGAMLRQNFALHSTTGNGPASALGAGLMASAKDEATPKNRPIIQPEARVTDRVTTGTKPSSAAPLKSGTYEMAATESLAPLAPGAVRVNSPLPDGVGGAALEVEASVTEKWSVMLEVEGTRISEAKIGVRRVDRKNKLSTYTFVGISLRPGPNRIKATAMSPAGEAGQSVELITFGRGPAKRLEVVTEKTELKAGGRDSTRVRVRAYDQWGHPAADAAVALVASAGRLLGENEAADKPGAELALKGAGTAQTSGIVAEQVTENMTQQVVSLVNGEGTAQLIAGNQTGATEIRASTGVIDARTHVQITAEVRPSILVGLAQMSFGSAAPEMSLSGDSEGHTSRRLAFFYRGQLFGENLLTLAYDSQRPLNRTAGSNRLFQLDPLERAYPVFGDSSTRYEDAPSNSKLYARLDRGRSYFLFGDFETEHKNLRLAGYTRKLTGIKAHVENSRGDYISVTGARPDTAFARDVFAGGGLALARLSHGDLLAGSEQVVIEVRDRRNPEIIISHEPLIRSVDYNLDAATGEIFFMRPVSSFDFALNLVQIVVTYEHSANDMSSAVYTGRAVKNFEQAGLRLGLSVVNQKQGEFGTFTLGGFDGEKKLPYGGTLQFEYAMSRGQTSFSGNLLGAEEGVEAQHNGSAYHVEWQQPLPYREAMLRASFARADARFLNPFGATVTPGSQRAHVVLDMKARASSKLSFGLTDERNQTDRVSNRRLTGSFNWTESWNDRVRTSVGYDFRKLTDATNEHETSSNLVTVGAEWQATDKLQLSIKREQNLGAADPTYPDQTTLQANYQYNQWARLFMTQRLASAPIVPISDAGATGFVSTSARREIAIGVETKLGRYTSLASRYQLENGLNGTDSFAIIGLTNRLPLSKQFSLDLGYERGFHLAGEGESFHSATLGFAWQPTENFRSSGRYELRNKNGFGSVLSLGAAGRLGDNLTALARFQLARAEAHERQNSSLNAMAAMAWRPLETDRFALLFSYTHRNLFQEGLAPTPDAQLENGGATSDRTDTLSTDAYLQATKNLELYGRFALKFGQNATPDLASVSVLTYLAQGRAVYRLGKYLDAAGEMRMLAQPSSGTRRNSFGAELGFWALSDLRLGGGYNFTSAIEPNGSFASPGRRGFYFTISSKLSNLFNLFGTPSDSGLQANEESEPPSGGIKE